MGIRARSSNGLISQSESSPRHASIDSGISRDLLELLVNSADTGLALFKSEAQAQQLKFTLCYCNTAFQTLLGIETDPLDRTFGLPIFQREKRVFTFFQLLAQYKSKTKGLYRICLAQTADAPAFFVSLNFADITFEDQTFVRVSVINFTNEQKESLDALTLQF